MKTKEIKYLRRKPEPMVLKEVAVAPGIGEVISVRSAKAHLSALLDLVASGREITITSDGKPKAKLVKAETHERGKIFQGMGDYLMKQPIHRGPTADEIIRAGRDSRP
ncbi:MAG: type II toxin-antitoxin system prevent-host-death family antitoxin [Verrucomicrobiota bacterium]|jgi:prevent-host-death family protein